MKLKTEARSGAPLEVSASDEELVARCLAADQLAWFALVDKYKELVWSVPLRYRLSPDDCADIFQAVWLDLFSELKNLRHVRAIRSWLITATSHRCYHWKRRLQGKQAAAPAEAEWDPEDTNPSYLQMRLQVEREQLLREAMLELPERCREMILMLFFEEPARPYEDVARNLGLAVGSIGFIRGRCLKKLREVLEGMNF